jgi:transcription initiation factor TFIIF subunit beta
MAGVIPQVKVELAPDVSIKNEQEDVDMPSPAGYVDDEDGDEDAGDLDFAQAAQTLWLSHIPRSLWEDLAKLQDDDEIDLGTIRVEGPEDNPARVGPLFYLLGRH